MNECIDTILQRKSIRSYLPDPIPEAEKQQITEAMLRAPTAGNQMLYSVIEVETAALKAKLAETCDHQPFIASAPWVLIFLADSQRIYDFFRYSDVDSLIKSNHAPSAKPQEADLLLAACDALIAAHTAVLAAESLGIGTCYIGDIMENYEIHRDLLKLPQYAVPITMLCLGYPTEQQKNRPSIPRLSRDLIISRDSYRHLQPEEARSLYDANLPPNPQFLEGAKNHGQHIYLRKFSSPFMQEMRRSVQVMLENWREG
ncbi:MAG: nitroreductase family protein [Spirochaetia bacterium]